MVTGSGHGRNSDQTHGTTGISMVHSRVHSRGLGRVYGKRSGRVSGKETLTVDGEGTGVGMRVVSK